MFKRGERYGKTEMEVREYLHGITATIERLKVGGEESVGKDDSEFSNLGGAFNLLKHA